MPPAARGARRVARRPSRLRGPRADRRARARARPRTGPRRRAARTRLRRSRPHRGRRGRLRRGWPAGSGRRRCPAHDAEPTGRCAGSCARSRRAHRARSCAASWPRGCVRRSKASRPSSERARRLAGNSRCLPSTSSVSSPSSLTRSMNEAYADSRVFRARFAVAPRSPGTVAFPRRLRRPREVTAFDYDGANRQSSKEGAG